MSSFTVDGRRGRFERFREQDSIYALLDEKPALSLGRRPDGQASVICNEGWAAAWVVSLGDSR